MLESLQVGTQTIQNNDFFTVQIKEADPHGNFLIASVIEITPLDNLEVEQEIID